MATKAKTELHPLLVTTEHRGVFFGYGQVTIENVIRLVNARMITYWSSAMKGLPGLAAIGPDSSCKVGLAAPAITLQKVTSIMEVSPEAVEKFEKGPWNG